MNPSSRLFPPLLLVLLGLHACTASAPRLQLPFHTDANCESRSVKQTAIDSIVASIDDTIRPGRYPGDALMHATVKRGGGVFAYWRDQPFPAADTARALGVSGELFLKRAVITNHVQPSAKAPYREVWLTFATPNGDAIVLERAYDVQNVCIEGRREI